MSGRGASGLARSSIRSSVLSTVSWKRIRIVRRSNVTHRSGYSSGWVNEYGFTGKITIVKDYICGVRQRRREMFVPLTHPPGHAQVDFGEALAVIGGVERKIHFLAMSLPHSDACFVKAYPGETTEAFCDGHVSGFSFFGGVPRSILYDNTRIAVARILGDGKRQRTRVFSELRSHYLFEDRFGRPGKGNDKGKVEGIVGYCRRNFLVPMPRFRNFDDLNTHLEPAFPK